MGQDEGGSRPDALIEIDLRKAQGLVISTEAQRSGETCFSGFGSRRKSRLIQFSRNSAGSIEMTN
jgi:hypothetical protein